MTHPVLPSFLSKEFLLHIPCWLFFFFFIWGVSLTQPMLVSFFIGGVSLTHSILGSFLSGEFVLETPCLLHFYRGSFSYSWLFFFLNFIWGVSLTHWDDRFTFLWGVSLTHPVLASVFFFFFFFYLGSFSYTSHVGFTFLWGVSRTHPLLTSFLFMSGVSLIHPVLQSFLSAEFLLHIPCWLFFFFFFFNYLGCFCDTSCAGFFFYLGSFSYTSRAGFFFFSLFFSGVSLTHPMSDLLFCGEFLLHVHC